MKRKKSIPQSKEDPETSVLYRVTKRSIVSGGEQRGDGIRVTRQGLGPLTTDALANEIQGRCSLTRGDVLHVLTELQSILASSLRQGQMVQLKNIGTFDLRIGTAKPMYAGETLSDRDVVVKGITFRPAETLMAEMANVKFQNTNPLPFAVTERDSLPILRRWFEEHEVLTLQHYMTACHCSRSTAQRRIRNLLETRRLKRYPHSTTAYIPDVNLYSIQGS